MLQKRYIAVFVTAQYMHICIVKKTNLYFNFLLVLFAN